MVALHSSDPATVYLSVQARCPSMSSDDLDRALYVDRSLVRIHAMRRTMWVIPTRDLPVFEAAAGLEVAVRERARLFKMVDPHVEGEVAEWFERARSGVITHLREHDLAYADELRRAVPELDLRFQYGAGSYGVGPRVLFQMAVEGDIVRSSPRGSWRSSVYAWTLRDRWLPAAYAMYTTEEARVRLVRRWLSSFGPGTFDDLVWWTGWGKRVTRTALDSSGAEPVDLGGVTGFVAAGDGAPIGSSESWAALLPSLDPTTMAWKDRGWYLGEHGRRLFDRNGNAGPTVWVDGRVVGGWAQRSGGEIVIEILEPIGAEARALIDDRIEALQGWLGDHVVVPRFRTPLESALTD